MSPLARIGVHGDTMTSILDQYEKASQQVFMFVCCDEKANRRSADSSPHRLPSKIRLTCDRVLSFEAGTTAFLNELLDRDRPMFQKQKAAFTPRFPIRHLSAGSGKLVMVLVNGLMLRVDTRRPEKIDGGFLEDGVPVGHC